MIIQPKEYELELIRKEKVSKDAYSFYFQRPSDSDFLPGQYLRIKLNIENPNGRGNTRLFSIASSPTEKNHLMITVRIIQSTFKKTLENLNQGDRAKIAFPFGVFTLKEDVLTPIVLIAGGIGITPFRSMIVYANDKKLNIPITLFSSFRTPEDIVFDKELKDISANNKLFKLIQTVTRPEDSSTEWKGLTGRINDQTIKSNIKDLYNSLFYIAGPPLMVEELSNIVKSLGVDQAKIKIERFTGY